MQCIQIKQNNIVELHPQVDGACYLLEQAASYGIDTVFMVPGKIITPFMKALSGTSELKAIVPAHEAGAGYMADGYARVSGKFGVCVSISGPGTTNTIPAMTAAFADGIPVLFISGGIDTRYEGIDAFQDASSQDFDEVSMVKTVTCYAQSIKEESTLPRMMQYALSQLNYHKKPVFIQVPLNIQSAKYRKQPEKRNELNAEIIDISSLKSLSENYLANASNIALLVGRELNKPDATQSIVRFAEKYSIPVATTLQAKGVFPEDHPLSLGVFGYGGTKLSAETLLNHDTQVLIALGCQLSQRNTLNWASELTEKMHLVQINNDVQLLNKSMQPDLAIHSDPIATLNLLSQPTMEIVHHLGFSKLKRHKWLKKIKKISRLIDINNLEKSAGKLHPARVISKLRECMPRDTIAVVDSGAHRVFAAHYWEAYEAGQYLSSTKLAPMGWAIPAGIGAKLAKPKSPVVVITGDGCMLMHGSEIQTAARYNIPVIFVVLNNSAHGGIHLDSYLPNSFDEKLSVLPTHNWCQIAKSFGLDAMTITNDSELEPAFNMALELNKPVLIEVHCQADCKTPIYKK